MISLIGLCGYAGVGKDAICKELGAHRIAFADELKKVTDPLFPLDAPKEVKRPVYVAYGAAMRGVDPDHWVKLVKLPTPQEVPLTCVTDIRYLNEAKFVLSSGGLVVRVWRRGVGPANDEEAYSIAAIDTLWPQLPRVLNDRAIEEAADHVRRILLS